MKKLYIVPFFLMFFSIFPLSSGKVPENTLDIFGGGKVTQIGIVVHDIEKASQAYAEFLGMDKPQWALTDAFDKAHTIFRGRPTEARAKLAFFELGNITIELIEPVGGPSTWQEFLEEKGDGIHHIAFEIKDMENKVDHLTAGGMTLLQKGDYEGGRYSYMDAVSKLGLIIELLENFDQAEEAPIHLFNGLRPAEIFDGLDKAGRLGLFF